jgi:hypothetical protein
MPLPGKVRTKRHHFFILSRQGKARKIEDHKLRLIEKNVTPQSSNYNAPQNGINKGTGELPILNSYKYRGTGRERINT